METTAKLDASALPQRVARARRNAALLVLLCGILFGAVVWSLDSRAFGFRSTGELWAAVFAKVVLAMIASAIALLRLPRRVEAQFTRFRLIAGESSIRRELPPLPAVELRWDQLVELRESPRLGSLLVAKDGARLRIPAPLEEGPVRDRLEGLPRGGWTPEDTRAVLRDAKAIDRALRVEAGLKLSWVHRLVQVGCLVAIFVVSYSLLATPG